MTNRDGLGDGASRERSVDATPISLERLPFLSVHAHMTVVITSEVLAGAGAVAVGVDGATHLVQMVEV
jgi:hypothetical protein